MESLEQTNYIRFNYRYRDYANYKKHNSVFFSNPTNFSLEEIEKIIRSHLYIENYFLHSQWQLPDLHFEKTDWEDDHPYHEFVEIETVQVPETEPLCSIEEFMDRVRKSDYTISS